MAHPFDPIPRPTRPYRESDHDPNRDRPVRGWNVVWALAILTASAPVDLATATAELRHEKLRDWQAEVCRTCPPRTPSPDVFDLDERPRLFMDDGQRNSPEARFDRVCE